MKILLVFGFCIILMGCQKETESATPKISEAASDSTAKMVQPTTPAIIPALLPHPSVPSTADYDSEHQEPEFESDEDVTANNNKRVKVMVQELVDIDQSANSSLDIPMWKRVVDRYQFSPATPLEQIDYNKVSPVNGLSMSSTTYAATESEVEWPTLFLIYRGDDLVAMIGEDVGLTNEAASKDHSWTIHYTPAAKQLGNDERLRFEHWFNDWINSIN